MDLLLNQHHGVISRAQLLAADYSSEDIRKLVASESLRPLRRGWYADSRAHPEVVRAVRAGGALSCISALRLHGLWAPKNWPSDHLHVRRSRHYERLGRTPSRIRSCRIPGHSVATVSRSVDPLGVALSAAIGCLPAEVAVTLMDSALNQQRLTEADLHNLTESMPWPAGVLRERTDPGAQSGTESLVRQRLRAKGVKLRTQVQIGNIGRVDILVGDRLIIEVDSWTYHSSRSAFALDRSRDRRLVARGYLVIRLTFEEVLYLWPLIEPDLLAVIRGDRHRWRRRSTASA